MRVLQITAHFSPNTGGVETHLSDLVHALTKRRNKVFVLTYRPLTTKAEWSFFEKQKGLTVLRLPWIPGFFYKLVDNPVLEFIYLFPGLFLALPFVLAFFRPDVIHSHGLVAGAVGVFWGRLFRTRVVVATHSLYHFPQKGLYRNFVKLIFSNADFVMGLSSKAVEEIKSLGISKKKVGKFTYWIDLTKFQMTNDKSQMKKKLGWEDKFVVLFVGRLVAEKGVRELLEAMKMWDENIYLAVAGTGPMESNIKAQMSQPEAGRPLDEKSKNLIYLGRLENKNLPPYYSAADLVIVPSTHEEGFGRVILESLACGTPVVAAKRGAIPEAMDESVGKFIDVSLKTIKDTVEDFYKNQGNLTKLSINSRMFAEKRYSKKNVEEIIQAYNR